MFCNGGGFCVLWSRLHAIYWNFRCLKTGLGHLHIHFWPARNAVGGTMQLSRARALCGQQHRSRLTPGDGACGCGRRSSRPHPAPPAPPASALAAVLVPAFASPSPGIPESSAYQGGLPRARCSACHSLLQQSDGRGSVAAAERLSHPVHCG